MYTAKIIKFPFSKTYKCKGHTILKDLHSTMLILENEKRIFIPNKYIIEFCDGWFKMELNEAKKKGLGKANITHDLKEN